MLHLTENGNGFRTSQDVHFGPDQQLIRENFGSASCTWSAPILLLPAQIGVGSHWGDTAQCDVHDNSGKTLGQLSRQVTANVVRADHVVVGGTTYAVLVIERKTTTSGSGANGYTATTDSDDYWSPDLDLSLRLKTTTTFSGAQTGHQDLDVTLTSVNPA